MRTIHSWAQSSERGLCRLMYLRFSWEYCQRYTGWEGQGGTLGANINRLLIGRLSECKWSSFPGDTLTRESWVSPHNNPSLFPPINANWPIRTHQLRLTEPTVVYQAFNMILFKQYSSVLWDCMGLWWVCYRFRWGNRVPKTKVTHTSYTEIRGEGKIEVGN